MSEQTAIISLDDSFQENEALSVFVNNDPLPSGWNKVKLIDWLENKISMKNGFADGGFNQEGQGTPHLRPFNVTSDGFIDLSQVKYVENVADNSPYLLRVNDIIFNNTNSEDLVGKTSYFSIEGKFVLSNHMTIIRILDNDCVDAFWLAMKLQHLWRLGVFKAICRRHVGQASISIERLGRLSLSYPSLPEQRAIAHILQTVQQAIHTRRKELELERERKAVLMHHLFTYSIRNEPTKRSEIGEIPKSWNLIPLGEVIVSGPKNGIYKHQSCYGSGVSIIRINDFNNDGEVISRGSNRVNLSSDEITEYQLKPNDILINRVNSVSHLGKTALVGVLPEACVFESNMMCFAVNTDIVMPEYTFRFLCSPLTRMQIRDRSRRAVAQSSINQNDVKSILIPLCSIAEQQDIIGILRASDIKIAALEKEITLHEELFRTLLNELMTGRISTLPLVEQLEKGNSIYE